MGADVFIVVRDHAATLGATLASLREQTLPPERVVLVDNSSTDRSLEVASASRLALDVVRFPENRGFCAAANEALRRTSSPWVLSLNPDCRLSREFLERLVQAAEHHGVGSASSLLMRADGPTLEPGDRVDSAGMVVAASGRHFDRGAGRRVRPEWTRPAWVFGASGAAALYRRAALDEVAYPGGEVFDETFFAYREDADLAWRLQRRGWRCLFWPEARGYHARGLRPEQRRRGSQEINRHSVRNRFLLRWSNADWRWLLCCFPWWLLRDVMVVGACATTERTSLPALAEAWALRAQQRRRGAQNAACARVSGWWLATWFLPGGATRRLEQA